MNPEDKTECDCKSSKIAAAFGWVFCCSSCCMIVLIIILLFTGILVFD